MNSQLSCLFSKSHEWTRRDEGDVYFVGLSDHAQGALGDIVYIEFPEVGTEVFLGQSLGVVESVKAASDYYAPISGVVVAVNQTLLAQPAKVNTDPYDSWLVKIKNSHPEEINNLLSREDYEKGL